MIKLLLYTILFGVGGYYIIVTYLPPEYKSKMLAAIGLGETNGSTFSVFNPASKREELLQKLETNLAKVENIQNVSAEKNPTSQSNQKYGSPTSIGKNIIFEGNTLPPNELVPLIQEQKNIISQLKDLNPQTGIMPKVISKILGVDSTPQITPEQKAEICK